MLRGINYGHHLTSEDYKPGGVLDIEGYTKKVRYEMLDILSLGFEAIRINLIPAATTSTAWSGDIHSRLKLTVKIALSLPFKEVIYGHVHGRPVITSTNIQQTSGGIKQYLLPWAETLNDERLTISIGNEEEEHPDGSTMTSQQIRDAMLTLASEAQSIYTKGKIVLESSVNSFTGNNVWTDNNIGDLDRLGVNIYTSVDVYSGGFNSTFKSLHDRFGSKLHVSEFNCYLGWNQTSRYGLLYREDVYTKVNMDRRNIIERYGHNYYFFMYKAKDIDNFEANPYALIARDGTRHQLINYIGKPMF